MTRNQRTVAIAIALLAVLLILAGCVSPETASLKQGHPDLRLFWHEGRPTYLIILDPWAVPPEIIEQMTDQEVAILMRLRAQWLKGNDNE